VGSIGLLEKLLIPHASLNESGLKEIGSVILAQLGIVRFASGGQMIVGISLSVTVTVKLQVTDDPNASVTLYVTEVIPVVKLKDPRILFIPLMGEAAIVAPTIIQVRVVMSPSVSLIVAARPLTAALQNPGSVFAVLFPGHTMVGGAASAVTLRIFDFAFLFNKP